MLRKIFAGLAVIALAIATTVPALGQQIPAGYALVPLSALGAQPLYATPQTTQFAANYTQTIALSPTRSALRASDSLGFVGSNLNVIATLRDESGRVLTSRSVTLTSSRAGDVITPVTATTNAAGEATFHVSGKTEGVATFTAIDQTGATIGERPRVVFLNRKAVGGNKVAATTATQKFTPSLFRADAVNAVAETDTSATEGEPTIVADNTAAAYNEFVQIAFPDTVTAHEPNDITISITKADGTIIDDYTGTVSFASTDPAAIVGQEIPLSFDFTPEHHGTHTFAKAVTFVTTGRVNLTVSSSTETTSPATKSIVVLGAGQTTLAPTITTPTTGTTTNKAVELAGSGPANVNIAAFVDDRKTLTGSTDETGAFTFNLTGLKDGTHALTVAVTDNAGQPTAMSEPVTIAIDTTPPALIDFKLLPGEKVDIGTQVKVGVKSEKKLPTVTLTSGDKTLVTLIESATTAGLYTGSLAADVVGTYPLAVHLADALGNEATIDNVANLTVSVPITIIPTADAKSQRVDLKWAPPVNHATINHYLIHYGAVSGQPDKIYATTDNRTAWYVGELNNDTVYYFTIESLDAKGAVNGRSEEISATPKESLNLAATACDGGVTVSWLPQSDTRIVRFDVGYGVKSKTYLETVESTDGTSARLTNLINGVPYYFALRGYDADGAVIFAPDAEATATPGGASCGHGAAPTETPIELWQKIDDTGRMFLAWNAVPDATGYRVYAGTQPNVYDLPTATVTTTYLRPTGLTPGATYYFAVKAIVDGGHEAARTSNVVQFNILKTEVGPAETLAASIGIALLGAWFIRRRWARNVQ